MTKVFQNWIYYILQLIKNRYHTFKMTIKIFSNKIRFVQTFVSHKINGQTCYRQCILVLKFLFIYYKKQTRNKNIFQLIKEFSYLICKAIRIYFKHFRIFLCKSHQQLNQWYYHYHPKSISSTLSQILLWKEQHIIVRV